MWFAVRKLLIACLLLLLPTQALAAAGPVGRVAYIWQDRLWTYDLATGERQPLPESGELSTPQWSPSGRYLTVRMKEHSIVRAAKGAFRRPLPPAEGDPAWAPNADRFAHFTSTGKLQIESPQGQVLRSIPIPSEPHYESPHWSPNGAALAWVEANGEQRARVMTARARFGKPRQLWSISGSSGHACVYVAGWQTRRSILLYPQWECSASLAADGQVLGRLDAKSGAFRLLQSKAGSLVVPLITVHDSPAISRQGRAAVAEGVGRISTRMKQIVVIEPDGQVSAPVSEAGQAAIQPAWAPDGQYLAWSGAPDYRLESDWHKGLRERRIWVGPSKAGVEPVAVTADPAYQDEAPIWTADGQHILFARLDEAERGSLWLLNIKSRQTTKLTDLDVGPTREYYGWREWGRVFAYSGR